MKTTRHQSRPCPFCGQNQNSTTRVDADDGPPKAGDITLCWNCARVCVITTDLGARRPTSEDLAWIASQPGLIDELTRLQSIIRLRGRPN